MCALACVHKQVRHGDVGDPVLRATNGKMLAVILDNPSFTTLVPSTVSD